MYILTKVLNNLIEYYTYYQYSNDGTMLFKTIYIDNNKCNKNKNIIEKDISNNKNTALVQYHTFNYLGNYNSYDQSYVTP